MTQVHDTNFLTKCLPIQHRVHQDYLAANYCPTVEEGQQDFCVEKLARYYIGMLVSGHSWKSRICSTHNFFDRMPLSTTTLWMEQSTSVRLWVSVTLLGAEGEREFSCNCLEQFCPGTPARSASRAWSGLRPTSRIPSWSQSMLSTSSRTSAKVTLTNAFTFFYPDFFLDGWEGCKEHAINDFPAMHNMAMEKFFIPTEICNQVNLAQRKSGV